MARVAIRQAWRESLIIWALWLPVALAALIIRVLAWLCGLLRCLAVCCGLLLLSGCTSPLEPTPVSTNIVCPTGCVVPPGCFTRLSPPNHPAGYELVCPR